MNLQIFIPPSIIIQRILQPQNLLLLLRLILKWEISAGILKTPVLSFILIIITYRCSCCLWYEWLWLCWHLGYSQTVWFVFSFSFSLEIYLIVFSIKHKKLKKYLGQHILVQVQVNILLFFKKLINKVWLISLLFIHYHSILILSVIHLSLYQNGMMLLLY